MKTRLIILAALLSGIFSTVSAQSMGDGMGMGNGPRPGMDGGRPGKGGPKGGPKQQKNRQYEKSNEMNAYEIGKLPGKVYVFGFSQEFGDSVAYLTDITEIDSLALQKKTKFLPFRYELSLQMKEYLEGEMGLSKQTVAMFYGKKKSKVEKEYNKMKKRYMNMEHMSIQLVKKDDFHFIHPIDKMNAF